MRISVDDVKPLVDQMIDLLRQPHEPSRRSSLAAWFTGSGERGTKWRAHALTFFLDLRRRLDDPGETFADDAAHLVRWMDWDWDLERQPDEIRSLAPRIQQALGLLERSRGHAQPP